MSASASVLTSKHVVVIGGGLAGLAASYDLVRGGHRVTLLEAALDFGGLASSFRLEGHPVGRFYHFICLSDSHLLQLIHELGLDHLLHWQNTLTAFYHKRRMYSFGTAPDLLRFSAVPWLQRLRLGLHILHSRYRSQWRWLDQIPAKPWLIENIGEEAYNVIWHPLLRIKFGDYYDRISAAWIWHRIWRVARSRRSLFERETLGSLEHRTATLVDALVAWLRAQPDQHAAQLRLVFRRKHPDPARAIPRPHRQPRPATVGSVSDWRNYRAGPKTGRAVDARRRSGSHTGGVIHWMPGRRAEWKSSFLHFRFASLDDAGIERSVTW